MLAVTYRKTADLIPYVNNSRTHSEAQVLQIAASIKEFGFTNPVLVDADGSIIAGHGRVMAARKLGMDEVPTIELAGLTETQRKAYIIADNKLALNAEWNEDLLKLELQELADADFSLDVLGFDAEELGALLDDSFEQESGYSDKNAEYTPDDFDDVMELKFKFSTEQYNFVREKLLELNHSIEIALLGLLENERP